MSVTQMWSEFEFCVNSHVCRYMWVCSLSQRNTEVCLCFSPQSLQMLPQQRKAIAKFKEPAHALAFQQKFHR